MPLTVLTFDVMVRLEGSVLGVDTTLIIYNLAMMPVKQDFS